MFPTSASATTTVLGLRAGYYYRIKNVQTGYYLTIANGADTIGAQCVMSPRSSSHAQQFQLSPYGTGSYRLVPRSTSSGYALGVASSTAATHVGSYITLQSTLSNTLLSINRIGDVYYISPKDSSNVYVFGYSSAVSGAIIKTSTYASPQFDWIFEPVYTGDMAYYATADLTRDGGEDSIVANNIISKFQGIGYTSTRYDLPTATTIYSNSTSCRALVFHGHGGAGYIILENNGNLYSENATYTLRSLSSVVWSGMSFVMFVSCCSAQGIDERDSLVDVAYELGANCVLGFNNNVSGGEDYLYYMLDAIYNRPENTPLTIADAIAYADSHYSDDDKRSETCPAHEGNLVVLGNANICIDKRLN